jgi:hypothetical protein
MNTSRRFKQRARQGYSNEQTNIFAENIFPRVLGRGELPASSILVIINSVSYGNHNAAFQNNGKTNSILKGVFSIAECLLKL